MPFELGKARPENAGRKPGSVNKKNQEILDLAKELGCDPAKILMLIAMGNSLELGSGEVIEIEKRMAAADKLMPYLYGKRKPVDSNGDDAGLTLDSIFEAVNAVK